jgi:hypothetical protein
MFRYYEHGQTMGTYHTENEQDIAAKRRCPVDNRGNGYEEVPEPKPEPTEADILAALDFGKTAEQHLRY